MSHSDKLLRGYYGQMSADEQPRTQGSIWASVSVLISEDYPGTGDGISTLWNTTECCRGFEGMKDEISSSLKDSDILG